MSRDTKMDERFKVDEGLLARMYLDPSQDILPAGPTVTASHSSIVF